MFLGFFGGGRSRETESTQAWETGDLLGAAVTQETPSGVGEVAEVADAVPASEPVTDSPQLESPTAESSGLLLATDIVDAAPTSTPTPTESAPEVPLSIAPAPEVSASPEPALSVPEEPVSPVVETVVAQPEAPVSPVVEAADTQPDNTPEPEVVRFPSTESTSHQFVRDLLSRDLNKVA